MLELICDNRTGNSLEIVIPTFNEEKRIGSIIGYYKKEFDIVILDDSSSDKTIDLAIEAGLTVFRRLIRADEAPGDYYFVDYVNEITKSGYCFYMMADEFVERRDLLIAYEKLKNGNCIVLGRRIDWAYGVRAKSSTCITPKGFKKAMALYNPNKLHAGLEYKQLNGHIIDKYVIDVNHLHIISVKKDYGKVGLYAFTEVQQLLITNHSFFRFIKHFILARNKMLLVQLLRFKNHKLSFKIWLVIESIAVLLISILCLIEQRYLNSPEKQLSEYSIKIISTNK